MFQNIHNWEVLDKNTLPRKEGVEGEQQATLLLLSQSNSEHLAYPLESTPREGGLS